MSPHGEDVVGDEAVVTLLGGGDLADGDEAQVQRLSAIKLTSNMHVRLLLDKYIYYRLLRVPASLSIERIMDVEVNIHGTVKVSGSHPIIIIGPNGVGKTRLGVSIARDNNGERVAALRNVEITEIPMHRLQQAAKEVRSALSQIMAAHWRQSFELQNLLSEILAEDRESAVLLAQQSNSSEIFLRSLTTHMRPAH